jgi:hypothetical protein
MSTDSSGRRVPPPATGQRLAWEEMPAWLRTQAEARLGGLGEGPAQLPQPGCWPLIVH